MLTIFTFNFFKTLAQMSDKEKINSPVLTIYTYYIAALIN